MLVNTAPAQDPFRAPRPACALPLERLHRCACRCSAALSTCNSTVESLPPLKLNARALHLREQASSSGTTCMMHKV